MLEELFYPKSIAIVGASRNREKIGNIILRNIISTYTGKIYPVNNRAEELEGLKCYKSISDIKEPVDLIIFSIPREEIVEAMEEAGKAGIKAAVVITAGFRERDQEGARIENEMVKTASKYSMRFLGPNTMGIMTPTFNATFTFADVKQGNIAIVAQSGGMGAYMLNWAQRTRTGLSYFVGLGNQADIKEIDVFEFLSNDPQARAIFSYMEGISDGSRFLNEMPEITVKKPVVFLKGGASSAGEQAIRTHTGSLAGSYELFRSAVRTVGGIFVENLTDLLNLAKILSSEEPIKRDILIITNSGGHGVLTVDEIERNRLSLTKLPPKVQSTLEMVLPPHASPRNPLDLGGDANLDRYITALKIIQGLDCTKLVLVQSLATVSCVEVAKALLNFKGKGFVGVVMGLSEDAAARTLDSANVPSFRFPEEAVRAIRYYTDKREPMQKMRIAEPIMGAKELVEGKTTLKDYEAFKLMEIYGIRVPAWAVVSNLDEAKKEAERIGFPLVMKISLDEPGHKTELGGVMTNVEKEDVENVFNQLALKSKRILLQKQLSGVEVFIGGLKDATFGPSILVGMGGVYVEVIKSVSYGLSPVSEQEGLQMLKESKVYDMLTARKRNYNINAVLRTLSRISRMIVDLDVKEMDINPLIVNQEGAFAVDVRIVF
ncbi:MAG: acetate--CoA ligase family protein [Nitrososphaerota archaeon]|jgi:acetyl coenzyme A synthetase (ADP forming)-like protein|nr:acetate--CoA ligase family protein [Nitrososphaerota archaeon]MDG6931381.1 acetate--CoA ligase family protein [Nitrososphaerota archaeon]MDG6931591.1 acetate--CoA ligase family protein [Nitrososphaerota archaeon]MDG6935992.1 acetate--CoA ligase family protein [Nitrososphaerota archaeon]MDG6943954.1 acetate--CoA ligase family protein [Nitrososphaerota archaeon]